MCGAIKSEDLGEFEEVNSERHRSRGMGILATWIHAEGERGAEAPPAEVACTSCKHGFRTGDRIVQATLIGTKYHKACFSCGKVRVGVGKKGRLNRREGIIPWEEGVACWED